MGPVIEQLWRTEVCRSVLVHCRQLLRPRLRLMCEQGVFANSRLDSSIRFRRSSVGGAATTTWQLNYDERRRAVARCPLTASCMSTVQRPPHVTSLDTALTGNWICVDVAWRRSLETWWHRESSCAEYKVVWSSGFIVSAVVTVRKLSCKLSVLTELGHQ